MQTSHDQWKKRPPYYPFQIGFFVLTANLKALDVEQLLV